MDTLSAWTIPPPSRNSGLPLWRTKGLTTQWPLGTLNGLWGLWNQRFSTLLVKVTRTDIAVGLHFKATWPVCNNSWHFIQGLHGIKLRDQDFQFKVFITRPVNFYTSLVKMGQFPNSLLVNHPIIGLEILVPPKIRTPSLGQELYHVICFPQNKELSKTNGKCQVM